MFCISQAAYSNAKLFPGYYVDLKGDTVRCSIEFADWNLNPKTIKVQVNNSLREFGPDDIRAFGITGYDDFISAKVTYHTNPISGPDLPNRYSDSTVTRSGFLKVVESGVYSLYVFDVPERMYLFDSSPDHQLSELIYRVKMTNDTLQEDQSYKKQLVPLFMNEGLSEKYFNKISLVPYRASQIGSLFRVLNEAHTGVQSKKKQKGSFQVELFAGAIQNTFPNGFDGAYSRSNQFDPAVSPSGGINILYSIPGHFKSFRVGMSFGYNGYNSTISKSGANQYYGSVNYHFTTTYSETININSSFLQSNLYLMWVVNPLSKIKGFVKAGINCNFLLSDRSDFTTTYVSSTQGVKNGTVPITDSTNGSSPLFNIKSNYLVPVISAGIISGRSKLEFNYWPPVAITDPKYNDLTPIASTTFKIGSFGIFYYFSLFPVK